MALEPNTAFVLPNPSWLSCLLHARLPLLPEKVTLLVNVPPLFGMAASAVVPCAAVAKSVVLAVAAEPRPRLVRAVLPDSRTKFVPSPTMKLPSVGDSPTMSCSCWARLSLSFETVPDVNWSALKPWVAAKLMFPVIVPPPVIKAPALATLVASVTSALASIRSSLLPSV